MTSTEAINSRLSGCVCFRIQLHADLLAKTTVAKHESPELSCWKGEWRDYSLSITYMCVCVKYIYIQLRYNYIRIHIYAYTSISWKIIEYQISLKITMQLYASMQFDHHMHIMGQEWSRPQGPSLRGLRSIYQICWCSPAACQQSITAITTTWKLKWTLLLHFASIFWFPGKICESGQDHFISMVGSTVRSFYAATERASILWMCSYCVSTC